MSIQMDDVGQVRELQSALRIAFESPTGKNVMDWLEGICSWNESVFDHVNRDMVLLNDGKRQVLATIKTLLRLTAEEVVAYVRSKESGQS